MTNIFGIEPEGVAVITDDGAPSGLKDWVIWSPSYIDPNCPSLGHRDPLFDASQLMRFLMARGIRVILFCKVSISRI